MMMPVIRISDEVYEWLQKHATPFVDTPDSVIKRLVDAFEGDQQQKSRTMNLSGSPHPALASVKRFDPATRILQDPPDGELAKESTHTLVEQRPHTAGRGGIREKWRGHSKSRIVRLLASAGNDSTCCHKVLNRLGMGMKPVVMARTVKEGQAKRYAPEIVGPDASDLLAMATDITKG
jgi:hypothetical protein